jgi:hypothetical protein
MLARGATAKVTSGQENTGTLVTGLIQHKILAQGPPAAVHAWLAFIGIPPGIKEVRAEARPLN